MEYTGRPQNSTTPGALFKIPLLGSISGAAQHIKELRDTPNAVIKKQRLSWEN
jgi:hypothetical protein